MEAIIVIIAALLVVLSFIFLVNQLLVFPSMRAARRRKWDKKTDEQVLDAYQERKRWVESLDWLESITGPHNSGLLKLRQHCQYDLDNLILPQMKKRGLPL